MNRFRTYAIALAAVVASLALAPRAQAQTISACSANKSGSMYRVGVSGAPADCTNANHKKETWNVQGPQGPQGAPGVAGYELVATTYTLQPGAWAGQYMVCPSGKRAIGGGLTSAGYASQYIQMSYSGPSASGTGWEVYASNTSTVAISVVQRMICATIAP